MLVVILLVDTDDDIEHARDDVESETPANTGSDCDGVIFDSERNCWLADSKHSCMTAMPLPQHLPKEAASWVRNRQSIHSFFREPRTQQKKHNNSPLPEGNMMLGDDCYPDQSGSCSQCDRDWESASVRPIKWFVVRTAVGAFARKRFVAICECDNVKDWDPSSEYIHAINDKEGGT